MILKTSIRTALLLAFVAIGCVVGLHQVSAEAVQCSKYGGSCKMSCGDDEFSSNSLYENWQNPTLTDQALELKPGDAIDCGGQGVCCIPKGNEACSIIGAAFKPPDAGFAWGCTPLVCDSPLNPGIGNKEREYCAGTTTCCRYKVRIGTTESYTVTKGSDTNVSNPLGSVTTLTGAINRVIRVFLGMVGALAFAVFVYSGVVWMTAGSSDRVKTAKDAIKYAAIGLILIGFSYAITNFIVDAFANKGSFAPAGEEAPAAVQEATPLQD